MLSAMSRKIHGFEVCHLARTEVTTLWPEGWQPEWLLEGLIQKNAINFIIGAPKSHKTQLRRYLIACSQTNASAWNEHPANAKPPKTLCLIIEDNPRTELDRMETIARANGHEGPLDGVEFLYTKAKKFNLLQHKHLQHLAEYVHGEGIELITIDPLINFHTADENLADGMSAVMDGLHLLSTLATVVVVHHTSKPGEMNMGRTIGERARGSSAIAGASNSTILIERTNRTGYAHKLSFEMKSAPTPDPVVLLLDWDSGLWTAEEQLSEELVLNYVFRKPGLSKTQLIAEIPGRDSEIRKLLEKIIKEKRVEMRTGTLPDGIRGPKPQLVYPKLERPEIPDEV